MQHVACSCCKQKTSEKYLANGIPFLDQKIAFLRSVAKTLLSEPYHKTASE